MLPEEFTPTASKHKLIYLPLREYAVSLTHQRLLPLVSKRTKSTEGKKCGLSSSVTS